MQSKLTDAEGERKRRKAHALQDLAEFWTIVENARASWSACALRCFRIAIMAANSKHGGMLSPAWPHAPTHQLAQAGTYIVTAATYEKAHHFRGAERLAVLQRGLLKLTKEAGWNIEAWAIFSNHYHFIAHSPADSPARLSEILATLHKKTASWVNKLDAKMDRKVWHNFWETRLTHQTSTWRD